MKTWFVFVMDQYYPMGGMNDFSNSFETEEEANKYAEGLGLDHPYEYYEIYNISDKI